LGCFEVDDFTISRGAQCETEIELWWLRPELWRRLG
jgi:hypothetical protein